LQDQKHDKNKLTLNGPMQYVTKYDKNYKFIVDASIFFINSIYSGGLI